MALGIGPIATQFITQDATDRTKLITTSRWDAKVTRYNV